VFSVWSGRVELQAREGSSTEDIAEAGAAILTCTDITGGLGTKGMMKDSWMCRVHSQAAHS
jgi:urease gamma subunit